MSSDHRSSWMLRHAPRALAKGRATEGIKARSVVLKAAYRRVRWRSHAHSQTLHAMRKVAMTLRWCGYLNHTRSFGWGIATFFGRERLLAR
jgi:hypothetical protein